MKSSFFKTGILFPLVASAVLFAQESPTPVAPSTATPATPPAVADTAQPPATPTAAKIVKPTSTSKTYQDAYVKKDIRGLVSLDFVNVEISEIVKSISEITKRNFIYDEKVRGKITLVSPKPVTVNEAYRAFISALEVKELTVLKVGDLYKIIPIRDMKTQPLASESATGSYDEFVTRIIPVQHTNADEISKSLRGLVSKNGDLISYPATNSIILTDSIANIRRITDIIKKLDQKGFQESTQIIKLKYAPASDTAEKITRIFELNTPRSNVPNPQGSTDSNAKFISKVIPDERTNSIIVVANAEGFRRIQELIDQVDRTFIEDSGKGRVHVHYLQYADAIELASTLGGVAPARNSTGRSGSNNSSIFPQVGGAPQQAPQPQQPRTAGATTAQLGDDIKITADPYTNALIITASPTDYESILPIINKLDIRRPQAFVEAMILEVDINKAADIGIAGNAAGTIGGAKVFGATTFGNNSSVFLPTSGDSLQGLALGVQGSTLSIPLSGGESLSIPIFGGFFRALQTSGVVNVLSTPNILTQDNTEAEIVVGQVVPFITAQGRDVNNQPINQVQRENVAITLRLTPQINSSDELTLKIFQENQDLVSSADTATLGPTTSKRSAQTTVLVKDGQTITIGGLINDRIQDTSSKVPILGDIPLLGWLFKSKSKIKRKTSLVILLTPHIIRFPEDMEKISIRKNQERMNFNKQNMVKEHPGLKQYKMDRDLHLPVAPKKVNLEKSSPEVFATPTPTPEPLITGETPQINIDESVPITLPPESTATPKGPTP